MSVRYLETEMSLDELEVKIVDWRREHDMEEEHGSELDIMLEAELTTHYSAGGEMEVEVVVECRREGCRWRKRLYHKEVEV